VGNFPCRLGGRRRRPLGRSDDGWRRRLEVDLEGRWLGQVRSHRGERRRIVDHHELLEERGHLVFVGVDPALNELYFVLDVRLVALELPIKVRLSARDPAVGLLADPRHLGLRPLPDCRDVLIGTLAEVRRPPRRSGLDLLDERLRLGLVLAEGLHALRLGGDLHRPRQVGEELGRPVGGTRDRRGGRGGLALDRMVLAGRDRHHWGLRLLELMVVRLGRAVGGVACDGGLVVGGRGLGLGRLLVGGRSVVGAPGKPEPRPGIGRRHRLLVPSSRLPARDRGVVAS
jgi:hypothetical protein